MKLNNEILKNWEKDKKLEVIKVVDSQIMWLSDKTEMENIVFCEDIVDELLFDLQCDYECSNYDDYDIVANLRELQHDRIEKYLNFLKSSASKILQQRNKKTKICEVCGVKFEGTGKSKFCSNRCKQIDKRTKK